jgi:cytochrome c1
MKIITILLILFFPSAAFAAEAGYPLEQMTPDLHDKASLQRGARTYMNYCLGCHSLQYQRYERMANDLEIPHELVLEHLVFNPDTRIGSLIENSMSEDNAKAWFGAAPPDLTLYTSLKGGPDYIYTYLKSFYEDADRPFGVNNLVFENVGMPHVLVDLQGLPQKTCKQIPRLAANGGEMRDPLTSTPITEEVCGDDLVHRGYSPLELAEGSGSLSPAEYDKVVYDLSNFLYYVAEPTRLERERLGVYVLLFLAFFFVFTYLLGREYTKEFH